MFTIEIRPIATTEVTIKWGFIPRAKSVVKYGIVVRESGGQIRMFSKSYNMKETCLAMARRLRDGMKDAEIIYPKG